MHGALSFARCRNVVLKAHDRILEHGEHQHTLGIEVKAPTIGGLVLVFDQNIRLKHRQCPLFNRRAGLIASLTRIVCAGCVPEELRRRTHAAARVNARLLAATRPGATGAELYGTAARAYAEEGFAGEEHLHHQGGACGYRTRDWVAHPLSAEAVQPRQAFAWNPSITGTKVEETCLALADEVEVITTSPDWPSLQVEVKGRHYCLPDVLPV